MVSGREEIVLLSINSEWRTLENYIDKWQFGVLEVGSVDGVLGRDDVTKL